MKHVLVVDDDTSVLGLVRSALGDTYRVFTAHAGEEALAMWSGLEPLELVITDYMMPSMPGDELLGRLRERRPALKALILSGHGQILAQENPSWWAAEPFLGKPFKVEELRSAVGRLIGPGGSAAGFF